MAINRTVLDSFTDKSEAMDYCTERAQALVYLKMEDRFGVSVEKVKSLRDTWYVILTEY